MKYVTVVVFVILFTIFYFAGNSVVGSVDYNVRFIAYFNFLLFFSSLVCLKQYFWPGEENRVVFQSFNLLFIIVFYAVGWTYLINHKDYYYGYLHLSNFETIMRFALRWDIFSIMFWMIFLTFFINIIYIIRYRNYYE